MRLRATIWKLRYRKEMVDSTLPKFNREHRGYRGKAPRDQLTVCTLTYLLKINVPPIEYGWEIKLPGSKINGNIRLLLKGMELLQALSVKEIRYTIVNTQSVVYLFKRNLCDTNYFGYITQHWHKRLNEHRYYAIRKHLTSTYGLDKSKPTPNWIVWAMKCYSSRTSSRVRLTLRLTRFAPSFSPDWLF